MHIAVSSFLRVVTRFVFRDDTVSVPIIRSYESNFWGFIRGGQINGKKFGRNKDDSWKNIRGIKGFSLDLKISPMGMGGICKAGITQSTGKGLLKKS